MADPTIEDVRAVQVANPALLAKNQAGQKSIRSRVVNWPQFKRKLAIGEGFVPSASCTVKPAHLTKCAVALCALKCCQSAQMVRLAYELERNRGMLDSSFCDWAGIIKSVKIKIGCLSKNSESQAAQATPVTTATINKLSLEAQVVVCALMALGLRIVAAGSILMSKAYSASVSSSSLEKVSYLWVRNDKVKSAFPRWVSLRLCQRCMKRCLWRADKARLRGAFRKFPATAAKVHKCFEEDITCRSFRVAHCILIRRAVELLIQQASPRLRGWDDLLVRLDAQLGWASASKMLWAYSKSYLLYPISNGILGLIRPRLSFYLGELSVECPTAMAQQQSLIMTNQQIEAQAGGLVNVRSLAPKGKGKQKGKGKAQVHLRYVFIVIKRRNGIS